MLLFHCTARPAVEQRADASVVFCLIEGVTAKLHREHLQIVLDDGFDFFAGPIIGLAFWH